jgi:hypothetical protein
VIARESGHHILAQAFHPSFDANYRSCHVLPIVNPLQKIYMRCHGTVGYGVWSIRGPIVLNVIPYTAEQVGLIQGMLHVCLEAYSQNPLSKDGREITLVRFSSRA